MRKTPILNKLIVWPVYILVFLLPVLFLPWTADVLEFNKQSVLVFLALVALLSWLGKALVLGEIKLVKNPLNIAVMFFVLVYGLATLFSQNRYLSFVGMGGRLGGSLLSVLAFAVLYFVIINNFIKLKHFFFLIYFFLSGVGLVSIYSLLQIFGKFILPFDFTRVNSFNPIGAISGLGLFAASGLVLSGTMLLFKQLSRKAQIFLGIVSVLSGAVIILSNYWITWLGLAIAMILVFAFATVKIREGNIRWPVVPMVMLALAILFLLLRTPFFAFLNLPAEVMPSYSASFDIAKSTLLEHPLFGSGPSTFVFDYARYKSDSLNQTRFWNVKFGSSISEVFTLATETGLLGTLGFLGVVILFILVSVSGLIGSLGRSSGGGKLDNILVLGVVGFFATWFLVGVASFLYSFNITLWMVFWVFGVSAIALMDKVGVIKLKRAKITFGTSPRAALSLSLAFIIVIMVMVSAFYLVGTRYVAAVYWKKTIDDNFSDIARVRDWMARAITFEGNQDRYHRFLSQVLLEEFNQKVSEASSENTLEIQDLLNSVILTARQAKDLNPKETENWLNLAGIYVALSPYIKGSTEWSEASLKTAIDLEPTNPLGYTELGKIYLSEAGGEGEENKGEKENLFEQAKIQFEKAIKLKANYAPAHFQLAVLYAAKGDNEKSISKMREVKAMVPADIGVKFQLGVLYYNSGEFEAAENEFREALKFNESYANARWYLAQIYKERKEDSKAIEELENILRSDPENRIVSEEIERIKKGPTEKEVLPKR